MTKAPKRPPASRGEKAIRSLLATADLHRSQNFSYVIQCVVATRDGFSARWQDCPWSTFGTALDDWRTDRTRMGGGDDCPAFWDVEVAAEALLEIRRRHRGMRVRLISRHMSEYEHLVMGDRP